MSEPCPICFKPIADTGYIDHNCGKRLHRDLQRLAWDLGDLDLTLTRQARIGDPGGRASGESPLVFHYGASANGWVISNTLTTWARHIEEQRGLTMPKARNHGPAHRECEDATCKETRIAHGTKASIETRCALWLSGQVGWIRQRPEAEAMYSELTSICELLRSTIDRPADRVYLGNCDACRNPMYSKPGEVQHLCDAPTEGDLLCGKSYQVADRRTALLDMADDQLAIASDLARALTQLGQALDAGRIYTWAHRGQIIAHGVDQRRRPLYRVGEVRSLLAADEIKRRERGRKSHRVSA